MTFQQISILSVVVAIVLAPFALLLSPIWITWLLLERRGRRRSGRRAMLPHQERVVKAYCEAMIRSDGPLDYRHALDRMDYFLAAPDSPRAWRNGLLLTLMEYAPTLVLGLPFSRRSLAARKRFVDKYLTGQSALFRVMTFGKQLIRMAYYSDDVAKAHMGFVPLTERHKGLLQRADGGREERLG